MKITNKEVDYVARLARLALTDEEKDKFTRQLESILEYIDQLNKPDTGAVPPTSHVMPLKNVWRADEVRMVSPEERERILNNAPEREDDYFRVKKVIE
jgi:aspartyl-tRNA(Asn)/glutamyl-tRNA(Gln) amidotransferase subunit C